MKCAKQEVRTFYEFFKDYSCEGCIENVYIDIIKIGYSRIYVYYMGLCRRRYYQSLVKKRIRLLFKDIIIDSANDESKNIFLWLNLKDDFSDYFDDFENILENGYTLRIII